MPNYPFLSTRVADCESRMAALLHRAIEHGGLNDEEVVELNTVVLALIELHLMMSGRLNTGMRHVASRDSCRLH